MAAGHDVNGKRVRKSFTDRAEASAWLETAKGADAQKGLNSLPTGATKPLLTVAEKRAMHEEKTNGVIPSDLCDEYLTHIQNPNNPERPKDQRNPPQRVATVKAALGDRQADSLKPLEIRDWLISLGLAGATFNRYNSTPSAIY